MGSPIVLFATTNTSKRYKYYGVQGLVETTCFARLMVASWGATVEWSSTMSASLEMRSWAGPPLKEAAVLPQMTPCLFFAVLCDGISL